MRTASGGGWGGWRSWSGAPVVSLIMVLTFSKTSCNFASVFVSSPVGFGGMFAAVEN